MIVIESINNEKVKYIRKLHEKKYRNEYNEYLVEGVHLVIEAYKKGLLKELILLENTELPIPAPYNYYSEAVMKKISNMDHPSPVMGICKKIKTNEIIGNKILILDDIQDPGNLGTIIRSALAFGIKTIILSNNTVDLYNPKVIRATQGMMFHINIVIKDIKEAINELKNMSIPIYGTDVNGGIDVRSLKKSEKEKYALIVGNEGNGVKEEINNMCDKKLYISMNEDVESLNVAIATSILLYELGDNNG